MTGRLTRWAGFGRPAIAGSNLSTDAAVFDWAAVGIVCSDDLDLGIVENVLMNDRTTLAEVGRGHKPFGLIVMRIVDLLQVMYPDCDARRDQPEPLSLTTARA